MCSSVSISSFSFGTNSGWVCLVACFSRGLRQKTTCLCIRRGSRGPRAARTVHSRAGVRKSGQWLLLQGVDPIRSCSLARRVRRAHARRVHVMHTVRLTVVLGVTTLVFGQEAVVQKSTIWVDTVK